MDSDEELPSYQVPRLEHSQILRTPSSPGQLPVVVPSSVLSSAMSKCGPDRFFHSEQLPNIAIEHVSHREYCSHPKSIHHKQGPCGCSAPESLQRGVFDKDASWASSMESIADHFTPGKEFNTIEKATFFPQVDIRDGTEIQPRALWPSSSSDSFDIRPLDSSCGSRKEPISYERQMRVSDVCSVFKSMNMILPNSSADVKQSGGGGDLYEFNICNGKPFFQNTVSDVALPLSPQQSNSQSSSPSLFSPIAKSSLKSQNASLLVESCTDGTIMQEQEITSSKTLSHVLSSPDETKKNITLCETRIGQQTKPIYGSRNVILTPLEISEDDLFNDLAEIESICSQNMNEKPVNRKRLPPSRGLVPFNDFIKTYGTQDQDVVDHCSNSSFQESPCVNKDDKALSPKNSSTANTLIEDRRGSDLVSKSTECRVRALQGSASFDTPPIQQSRARKRLRLEVSEWNSTTPVTNIKSEVTDTQIFQVADDVDIFLPPSPVITRKTKKRKVSGVCLEDKKSENESKKEKEKPVSNNVNNPPSSRLSGENSPSRLPRNGAVHTNTPLIKSSGSDFKKTKNFNEIPGNSDGSLNKDILKPKTPFNNYDNFNLRKNSKKDENCSVSNSSNFFNASDNQNDENFVGFRTASNDPVTISKRAYDAAMKLFKESDIEHEQNIVGSRVSNISSAAVSDSSPMEAFNNRLNYNEDNCAVHVNKSTIVGPAKNSHVNEDFVGFRTANNTKVAISSNAVAAAKKMFSDCDLEPSNTDGNYLGFQTANNTKVAISSNAVAAAKKIFSDCDLEPSNTDVNYLGFQTANNTKVAISSNAVAAAKKIFSDCDLEPSNTDGNYLGFQTGNNTKIAISSNAVATAKKIFSDCDLEPSNTDGNYLGFQTTNNTKVAISSNAVAAAKKIFSDCDLEPSNTDGNYLGFQTANNTNVAVSSNFLGFQTGNNAKVAISSNAIAAAKKIFSDCDLETSNAGGNFVGFQTGNNAKVAVSNKAIAAARKIFSKCDLEPSNAECVGFRTGSNANVVVSSDAIAAAKKMFSDCEAGLSTTNDNIVHSSNDATATDNRVLLENKNCAISIQHEVVTANVSRQVVASNDTTTQKRLNDCDDAKVKCIRNVQCTDSLTNRKNIVEDYGEGSLNKPQEQFLGKDASSVSDMRLLEEDNSILESFNWEESVLPAWVASDFATQTQGEHSSSQSIAFLPKKTRKRNNLLNDAVAKKEVAEKRASARHDQQLFIREKGKVAQVDGSYITRKRNENIRTWLETVPEGPRVLPHEDLRLHGISNEVLEVTYQNAGQFVFDFHNFYKPSQVVENSDGMEISDGFKVILDDDDCAGAEEIERAFLAGPGVTPTLVPPAWVRHHYRLIVWKLACYERSCSPVMSGVLTPNHVLSQLKYRYDRELDRCERSALRRVLERDDTAAKAMVLVVLNITKLVDGHELLLSDGWYSCPARCDAAIDPAVRSGKLRVGTKIMTIGADLVGCEQGVAPLERPSHVYLKISTNSTRRVQWHRKLGFQRLKRHPPISLASILPQGGNICCVHVVVIRIYPLVFMEKTKDGRNIMRNARSEQRLAAAFQKDQESRIEKLLSDIQKELRASVNLSSCSRTTNNNSDDFGAIMGSSPDPTLIENISDGARARLWEEMQTKRDLANSTLQKRMAEVITQRSVRTVLRMRVVDLSSEARTSAVVSWWQPNEDVISSFSEGSAFAFRNVTVSNSRSQQLYLNTCRATVVEPLVLKDAANVGLPLRKVLHVDEVTSDAITLGELDIVGLVVYLHGPPDRPSKTVYLTDKSGQHFFGLVFWNGLQEYCCEDLLLEGMIVGVSNVQLRQSSASGNIFLGYVNETTLCVHNSRSSAVQTELDRLKTELNKVNLQKFTETCQDAIVTKLFSSNFTHNTSNKFTDVTLNRTDDISSVESNVSCNSPGVMRPTAASTPLRVSCQKRIEMLQKYGEAPALSPIPSVINPGKCRKPFKPPFANRSINNSRDS